MRSIASDLLAQRMAETRGPARTLNRALYESIRGAIVDGSLALATRLPPSRDLAAELSLSRNTVINAYAQLHAEGYLRTLTGSGTYVALSVPDRQLFSGKADPALPAEARPDALSTRGARLVAGVRASAVQWGPFMPGVPDVLAFPHRRFARITSQLWRSPRPEWLSYSHGGGHPALREALASHLRIARSVVCEDDQILITEGVHQAVDLIVKVLGDVGDCAWLEEPGYWGIRNLLEINGLNIRPVAVDADGLKLPDVRRTASPRFIFVTPSHQYPLGAVMSLKRRLALIDYAQRNASWIVEDDYDSEFRFAGHPFPSLQGLSSAAPVIYIGTFSKTLYPGLRSAYMVLPKSLVAPFRAAHSELYREGHLMTQAALAEFIGSGHYAAHIRRMRVIYGARRGHLLGLIERHLGRGWLHRFDSNAGLHLVIALPDGVSDTEVARDAARQHIVVRPLSHYYQGRRAENGLLLGFASICESDMIEPFERLARIIREHGERCCRDRLRAVPARIATARLSQR